MNIAPLLGEQPSVFTGHVDTSNLRIALIHYWYLRRRGGERVLDVLAELYPQSDLFIMVADKSGMPAATAGHRLQTSFLQSIPGIKRHYRSFMALYPLALEQFDLRDYDIVISQEAGLAKGILTRANTFHLNYCHSPMRHIWEMYHEYKAQAPLGLFGKAFYAISANYLRQMDALASMRVDSFVASSHNAALRIKKTYRRSADIVYPPVDLSGMSADRQREDFYLVVSPLVAYKRVDLAIQACNILKRRLIVIGSGEEAHRLREIAGNTVEFLGNVSDETVRDHYSRCLAFLFPGEEDIGLTPIEAQASGAPVIAFGAGGALESVNGIFPGEAVGADATGVFFEEQTPRALADAIIQFELNSARFNAATIAQSASRFDSAHFKLAMSSAVAREYSAFKAERSGPVPARRLIRS